MLLDDCYDDIPTDPSYELGYFLQKREFEEKFEALSKSGSARLEPRRNHQKRERDYFMYLYSTFHRAMMACAEKKGETPEEKEFLNRQFWKLSERVDFYKKKASSNFTPDSRKIGL